MTHPAKKLSEIIKSKFSNRYIWIIASLSFAWVIYLYSKDISLTDNLLIFLKNNKTDWNMWSAIGTILSAIVALAIAIFTYWQSLARDIKSQRKEAIEKIITPIRKELRSCFSFRWGTWYPGNRWHTLETSRLDFPFHYFWLDGKIKKYLEDFDLQWACFEYLSHQEKDNFVKLLADVTKDFLNKNKISIYCSSLGSGYIEEAINNIHWSCVVGGKNSAAVTIHSLVLENKNLSDYLEERKQEKDIPNQRIDKVDFSIHSTSVSVRLDPKPTIEQSDTLLNEIKLAVDKNHGIKQYIVQWQNLRNNGLKLIKVIDLWLSKQ